MSPAAADLVFAAGLGGTMAAAATALGTLPVLASARLGRRSHDALLGFGAGVMLAASSFSLLLPALAAVATLGAGRWTAGAAVGSALLAGAGIIYALDRVIPHEHFIKGPEGGHPLRLKRTWLFVFAICLHNLPEGIAIGVAFGDGVARGWTLATGIALQDLPEGMVVAIALIAAGYRRGEAVLVGVASGLVEPLGALAGAGIVVALPVLLPLGLGIAAGAMLYVVSHEIIPESHRQGHEHAATGGLLVGFVLMMVLDTALG